MQINDNLICLIKYRMFLCVARLIYLLEYFSYYICKNVLQVTVDESKARVTFFGLVREKK